MIAIIVLICMVGVNSISRMQCGAAGGSYVQRDGEWWCLIVSYMSGESEQNMAMIESNEDNDDADWKLELNDYQILANLTSFLLGVCVTILVCSIIKCCNSGKENKRFEVVHGFDAESQDEENELMDKQ